MGIFTTSEINEKSLTDVICNTIYEDWVSKINPKINCRRIFYENRVLSIDIDSNLHDICIPKEVDCFKKYFPDIIGIRFLSEVPLLVENAHDIFIQNNIIEYHGNMKNVFSDFNLGYLHATGRIYIRYAQKLDNVSFKQRNIHIVNDPDDIPQAINIRPAKDSILYLYCNHNKINVCFDHILHRMKWDNNDPNLGVQILDIDMSYFDQRINDYMSFNNIILTSTENQRTLRFHRNPADAITGYMTRFKTNDGYYIFY